MESAFSAEYLGHRASSCGRGGFVLIGCIVSVLISQMCSELQSLDREQNGKQRREVSIIIVRFLMALLLSCITYEVPLGALII